MDLRHDKQVLLGTSRFLLVFSPILKFHTFFITQKDFPESNKETYPHFKQFLRPQYFMNFHSLFTTKKCTSPEFYIVYLLSQKVFFSSCILGRGQTFKGFQNPAGKAANVVVKNNQCHVHCRTAPERQKIKHSETMETNKKRLQAQITPL